MAEVSRDGGAGWAGEELVGVKRFEIKASVNFLW